ncbi:hypothetical protein SLS62_001733 [Diatrype stigma]|uniref:Phosphatidylethanolamine-binding protein n=1 Tax=Diatrype stigma TaxID=117547 RepID=A0AAN9YT16_9PEZI
MPLDDDYSRALAESLAKSNLVPGSAAGLVPAGFKPTTKLAVSFGGAAKAVDLGNFFRAGECKLPPSISFAAEAGADPSTSYLLLLTDPDAPTPDDPKFAFWRHWVVGGLKPASAAGENAVSAAPPALTEYLGPGPKDEEPAGLALSKEDVGGEEFVQRRSFKPAEFADKHGLTLVAINWMTCAGDGWTEGL